MEFLKGAASIACVMIATPFFLLGLVFGCMRIGFLGGVGQIEKFGDALLEKQSRQR